MPCPPKFSDIYSYSIALWEIATRTAVYSNTSNVEADFRAGGKQQIASTGAGSLSVGVDDGEVLKRESTGAANVSEDFEGVESDSG